MLIVVVTMLMTQITIANSSMMMKEVDINIAHYLSMRDMKMGRPCATMN